MKVHRFNSFINESCIEYYRDLKNGWVQDFFDECPIDTEQYEWHGDCFEVSKDLVDWLPATCNAKLLVGVKPWEQMLAADASLHAVVELDGYVIDLTHGQFDPNKKYVVQTLADFKKEWPIAIKAEDAHDSHWVWSANKEDWPYVEDGKIMRKGKIYKAE